MNNLPPRWRQVTSEEWVAEVYERDVVSMSNVQCTTIAAVLAMGLGLSASPALAVFEGFEDPNWAPGGIWQNFTGGQVQQVPSGHNDITSAAGNYHGIINPLTVEGANSAYARLSSFGTTFGQGFTVSQDFYLDTSWSNGLGFDFAVSVNEPDGTTHQRDFIWHVGTHEGDLLINASNNSDWSYNSGKLLNNNGGHNYTVTDSGWYTFQTVFYDNGEGILAVDLNLLSDTGDTLYSVTRSNAADIIGVEVGGPRIGWLAYNNIDGLAVDNTSVVPEPAALSLLGLGGLALLRRRRAMA